MELAEIDTVGDALTFGGFRLIPARQRLLRDGLVVPLGSRALEILTVLVRRSGELVSKHDLIAAVWPDTFVDESNLKVNVCLLRRSLGDTQNPPKYIATVAGRGYRFVAPVHHGSASGTSHDLVGRQQEIADILAALRDKPLVTVVGHANTMGPALVRPLT